MQEGKAGAAADATLPGQMKDTSLGPWLSSPSKLSSPLKERDPNLTRLDQELTADTSLDTSFMPEDFALDFESFLNDADLLEGPALGSEQGSMPVANLFAELFTA